MDCILPSYRLSSEEFDYLWNKCVFVVDTNVLLDLYSYSSEVRKEIIETFEKVSDRIWIPHQVALEYYDNKERIKKNQEDNYKFLIDIIIDYPEYAEKKIKGKKGMDEHDSTHELKDKLMKKLKDEFSRIKEELMLIVENYPDPKKDLSYIDECISKLFIDKVGKPYSSEKLEEICKDGLLRYSQELPPGFEDKDNPEKKGIKIYGDLILWFQIIDMAKEKKLPVILVTNETKKDWWWKPPSSKQIGPRPELISEFNRNTKEIFYMYALDKFLMYSNKYLKTSIKKEYIEEVEEHRTEEESKAQEIEDLRQSAFSHYLEQQENMKKLISPAIADYLMQQENMKKLISPAFADYLVQQENMKKLISPAFADYLVQQENMKKLISPAFADYLVQQENMKKLISPALTCYTKQQESIKKSLLPDMSETAKPKKTLRSLKSSRKLDEKAGEKNSKND